MSFKSPFSHAESSTILLKIIIFSKDNFQETWNSKLKIYTQTFKMWSDHIKRPWFQVLHTSLVTSSWGKRNGSCYNQIAFVKQVWQFLVHFLYGKYACLAEIINPNDGNSFLFAVSVQKSDQKYHFVGFAYSEMSGGNIFSMLPNEFMASF